MIPTRIKCQALVFFLVALSTHAAPTSNATASSPAPSSTVPYASNDPNFQIYPQNAAIDNPQPIRGALGASLMSTPNIPIELENPSLLAPPTTDHGSM